jgi:hypothetical protein
VFPDLNRFRHSVGLHSVTILGCHIDGVWSGYWIYWHNSELQVTTALSLSSTLYKPPQHPISLFQPVVSSAVPWERLLTVDIFQLPALRSSCHSRLYRTLDNSFNPNCQLSTPELDCRFSTNSLNSIQPAWGPRDEPNWKHTLFLPLHACIPIRCLETGCITPLFIRPLHNNGCTCYLLRCLLRGLCLATGLHATTDLAVFTNLNIPCLY